MALHTNTIPAELYNILLNYPSPYMLSYGMAQDAYPNRRMSERKQVQFPVIIVIVDIEAEYPAMTVDVSPQGTRLLSGATLAADQFVRLHVSADPASFVEARVVWVGEADSASAGQAGFEFLIPPAVPAC